MADSERVAKSVMIVTGLDLLPLLFTSIGKGITHNYGERHSQTPGNENANRTLSFFDLPVDCPRIISGVCLSWRSRCRLG
jgi:hypothetical protein